MLSATGVTSLIVERARDHFTLYRYLLRSLLKSQSIMVIYEGDGDYDVDLLQDTFGVGARRSTSKGGTGGG